jgi:hypothetical protein
MKTTQHLAGWERSTFWLMAAVCLVLWVTGCVMYVLPASEVMDMTPIQVSLRHVSGVAHGVATWLFCVVCGRGLWPHVRVMWHRRVEPRKWWLGLVNFIVLAVIALGGLVLLYGSPDMHEGVSPLHFWLGALCPLVFLAHTWKRMVPYPQG